MCAYAFSVFFCHHHHDLKLLESKWQEKKTRGNTSIMFWCNMLHCSWTSHINFILMILIWLSQNLFSAMCSIIFFHRFHLNTYLRLVWPQNFCSSYLMFYDSVYYNNNGCVCIASSSFNWMIWWELIYASLMFAYCFKLTICHSIASIYV